MAQSTVVVSDQVFPALEIARQLLENVGDSFPRFVTVEILG